MVTADLIIDGLRASCKKQALEVMSEKAAGLFFGEADAVLGALIERERLGSTGIGCGVAIPHIRIPGLKRMYGILTCLKEPVDYGAVDGQPVDLIFLLLAPSESRTTEHLKALAQVSRFLKDATSCAHIRGARDPDKIAQVLEDWLKRQAA